MKLLPFDPGKLGPTVRKTQAPAEPKGFFEEGPFEDQPLPEGPVARSLLLDDLLPSPPETAESPPLQVPRPLSEQPSLFRSEPTHSFSGIETGVTEPSDASQFLRGKRLRATRPAFSNFQRDEASPSRFGPGRKGSSDNVVPFRRRRLRRSRRNPLLRWLKPLGLATAMVSLPVMAGLWFLTSSRFALQDVEIHTGERVPATWIRQAIEPAMGRNLPSLSMWQLERRLKSHTWVSGISLRKELPGRLVLRVVEKQEVALLRTEKELSYLDAEGQVIAPFDPMKGVTDQILVSLSSGSNEHGAAAAAIEIMREIARTGAPWADNLSEIEVLGRDDFKIYSTVLPFPLLVRKGMIEEKARRLEALMPQLLVRYDASAAIDLRFARRIILQPSVAGSPTANRFSSSAGLGEQKPAGIS